MNTKIRKDASLPQPDIVWKFLIKLKTEELFIEVQRDSGNKTKTQCRLEKKKWKILFRLSRVRFAISSERCPKQINPKQDILINVYNLYGTRGLSAKTCTAVAIGCLLDYIFVSAVDKYITIFLSIRRIEMFMLHLIIHSVRLFSTSTDTNVIG